MHKAIEDPSPELNTGMMCTSTGRNVRKYKFLHIMNRKSNIRKNAKDIFLIIKSDNQTLMGMIIYDMTVFHNLQTQL